MIYPESFESKIGFDKVRVAVMERCSGPLSAAEAADMSFSSDYHEVARRLYCVDEMIRILKNSLDLPLRDVGDVSASLAELKV